MGRSNTCNSSKPTRRGEHSYVLADGCFKLLLWYSIKGIGFTNVDTTSSGMNMYSCYAYSLIRGIAAPGLTAYVYNSYIIHDFMVKRRKYWTNRNCSR